MPVVGFLHHGSPEEFAPLIAAFRDGLGETGIIEGQNVAIEFRRGPGRTTCYWNWRPIWCAGAFLCPRTSSPVI